VVGSKWKAENKNSEEARRVNKMLDAFRMKAFVYQRELMNEGKDVTLVSKRP
jgi:hypothetical protein